jgi:hypothetical protein
MIQNNESVELNICVYCHCIVNEREAKPNDAAGTSYQIHHIDIYKCVGALRRRVAALEAELIEERVLTAELTDRLEICRECPAGMIQTADE